MAFWVYVLRCADGKYYTGHTDDLERRLAEHQSGALPGFTSRRRPVELAWSEYFQTRIEALEAERVVGGWSRGKKEALIADNWSLVSFLARPPKERLGAPGTGLSTSPGTSGDSESLISPGEE